MNDTQIDETDKYEIQDEKHKCQKSSSITSKSFNNGESAVQQNSTSASVAASETVVSNYLKDEPSVQPMVQEPTATTHTNSSTLVVKTEPPSVEIIDCDLSDSTQPLTEEPMSDVDDHPDVSDNGDRKNDNPAANSNSTKLAANENDVDGIEETLQCSLCIEILHEPVCVQPCLHCYCAGCYSQWMKKSPNCPQCRVFVQSLSKNHIVSNLVEAYLRSNPEKQRIAADIEKLNQSNTIKMDVMKFSKTNDSPENNYDSYESDSTDGDDGDGYFSGKSGNIDYPNSSCRQCYKNSMPGIANLNQPSTSTNKGAADKNLNAAPKFFCKTKQSHISCFCCQEVMPDRLTEKDAPPQQCTLCYMFFCHLYFGCTKADCRGCLNHFKDLKFNEGDLVRSINNNVIETRILLDFLTSSSKDWKTCFQECLAKLDARLFTTVPLLNSNSVICYTCGMRQLKHLLYTYRSNIQKELLPNEVTSRPDCYWGKNCRTQHHKMNHAERYNHICEQTRFH